MKKSYIILIIVIVAIIAVIGWFVSVRNSLVTLDENVNQAWAKVEVQYQRRFDLIPNLVETVKGYAKHESETLQSVTDARAGLSNAYNEAKALSNTTPADSEGFEKYNDAQAGLNRAFNIYVNAVREAYPDLKADKQFLDLQVQLEGTENRIATERGYYTAAVRDYNLRIRRFPSNVVASISGFTEKPQFKADAEAQTAPKVSF